MKKTIESILDKLNRFVVLYDELQKENQELVKEKSRMIQSLKDADLEIKQLEEKIRMVNISNSFDKSDVEVKKARKKINEYVREIDKCIALLNK